MPQIGWSELLVIIVLAILIIGPKDFPVVVKKIGSYVKKVKSYITEIQDDIENVTDIDSEESNKKNKKILMVEKQATIGEHLVELRSRILKCIIFLFITFIGCYFFADKIYDFLVTPYAEAVKNDNIDRRLIFTALHETFLTYLKLAFFSAFFISCPIILIQIWKFIAPGLYKNEKLALLPFMVATPVLFLLGGMLVYYLIMPLAIEFFYPLKKLQHQKVYQFNLKLK